MKPHKVITAFTARASDQAIEGGRNAHHAPPNQKMRFLHTLEGGHDTGIKSAGRVLTVLELESCQPAKKAPRRKTGAGQKQRARAGGQKKAR